jgi:hypothetical protein
MTIWRMHFECWIPKATNTHSGFVILIAFPLQQWYTNAPQCYVMRTLRVLLIFRLFRGPTLRVILLNWFSQGERNERNVYRS